MPERKVGSRTWAEEYEEVNKRLFPPSGPRRLGTVLRNLGLSWETYWSWVQNLGELPPLFWHDFDPSLNPDAYVPERKRRRKKKM